MPEQKIIDRDTYRSIKKMSREELQAFLMRYADGLLEKDGKSIDLREVEKDLRQIKGIGDKRVEEIMAVFEKHLGVQLCTQIFKKLIHWQLIVVRKYKVEVI